MTTNSDQGKRPDPKDRYGGYGGGYQPSNPADDPYGAYQASTSSSTQSDAEYAYGQQSQGQGQRQQQQQSSADQTQQQEHTYQPPASVLRKRGQRRAGTGSSAAGSSTVSSEERRTALFSYLGFVFTGLFFWMTRRKSPYVRFHAAQSVFLFGPVFVALLILQIIGVLTFLPLLGPLIAGLLGLIRGIILVPTVIAWIYLMYSSYRGRTVKLPIVGDYAERYASRRNPQA